MKKDISWLKLAGIIADHLPTVPSLNCPRCGLPNVEFQYVGDKTTGIGFLCVWCASCLHGTHISRVKIPPQAEYISKDSLEEVKNRIPNFQAG